jgi:H+/Cl- antiporter ClcA
MPAESSCIITPSYLTLSWSTVPLCSLIEILRLTLTRYLICLIIGPAFLSASIYICLGQIVIIYGESISRLRPRTYTIVFVLCDLLALILQAIGGALTSIAAGEKPDMAQKGMNIMIAGLCSHAASLLVFVILCAEFFWRVHKNQYALKMDCSLRELRSSRK